MVSTPSLALAENKNCEATLLLGFHPEIKAPPIQTTINNLMAGVLKLFENPGEIVIQQKTTSSLDISRINFFQRIIDLPNLDGSKNNALFSQNILIHEFTHAVFYKNFSRHSKIWSSVLELVLEYHADCKARNLEVSTTDFIKYIIKVNPPNLDELLDHIEIFTKILAPLSYAYQELFSDLVSVVELNNPDIVSELILSQLDPSNNANEKSKEKLEDKIAEHALARKFSGTTLNAFWPSSTDKRIHYRLAPTRIYLWEVYFSKTSSLDKKAKMLRIVFDTIAEEILELQNMYASLAMDSVEMNRRLMNRLHKNLSEFR